MADLMSLAILALARLRNANRLRLSVIVALAVAFAQVAIEGPRWQMVPAYGLTLLLFVVSMASSFGDPGASAGRRWRTRIALGAGIVWLAISALLPAIVPVFGFPPPSGPYAIGTLTFHWVDTARSEALAADPRAPGYFDVTVRNLKFRMFPVETTTGAIRLEDRKAGAVWLQLANKSMLMNQKLGQRLADACVSADQAVVAESLNRNPAPSVLDAEPANAVASAASQPVGSSAK